MNRFNSKLDTAEEITDEPKDKGGKKIPRMKHEEKKYICGKI